jgi:hypothetical protein
MRQQLLDPVGGPVLDSQEDVLHPLGGVDVVGDVSDPIQDARFKTGLSQGSVPRRTS